MSNPTRQWQATIWLDEKKERSGVVYGDSLVALREAAATWLRDHQPTYFSSGGDVHYFYSDGTYPSTYALVNPGPLTEGWYREDYPRHKNSSISSNKMGEFDTAVSEFINTIIPEKGPEYQDIAIVGGVLLPHLIKTIRREPNEAIANSMIRRGWHIISFDLAGEADYYGTHLKNRTTVYVLGHPEENAL